MSSNPASVLISRTDAIGDVVLTLPVAQILKERFPDAVIGFLALPYTHAVLEACPDVDEIVAPADLEKRGGRRWDAVVHVLPDARIAAWAMRVGIPVRIGTTNRLFHWWTCNRLIWLSRKRSKLHEAQLNLALLKPLGVVVPSSLDDVSARIRLLPKANLPEWAQEIFRVDTPRVVLHPSSRGSAREWPLENFSELAERLNGAGYTVFITGVESDRRALQSLLDATAGYAVDLVGKLSLAELMVFLKGCDGLVAASTGPLHLAAALGIPTVGLYPHERPMHAGRWSPLGPFAETLTGDAVNASTKSNVLEGISPEDVADALGRQMALRRAATS